MTEASVNTGDEEVASIGKGLLVMVGVEQGDSQIQAERIAERIVKYRVFPDLGGRMNLSLLDQSGELLLVPQFTLAADTGKGHRPGFSSAAPSETAARIFSVLTEACRVFDLSVHAGCFGADMQVSLVNDGPVTFLLRTS